MKIRRKKNVEYRNDTIALEGYNTLKLQENNMKFLSERVSRSINDEIDRVFDEREIHERHIFDD